MRRRRAGTATGFRRCALHTGLPGGSRALQVRLRFSRRSRCLQTMQVSNPQSPLQLYPRTSVVDVRVKSVSPLGPSAALVRFDTVRTDTGAQPQLANSFVAVTRYRYSTAPMSVDDRFAN